MKRVVFLGVLLGLPLMVCGVELSEKGALSVGKRVWQNECGGTVSGLTAWNSGEDFASLGIGHFIWYPKGKRGPFEESFPGLIEFLEKKGHKVPGFAKGPCPWQTKEEFDAEKNGPRLTVLRSFLANTVPDQAQYLALRLEKALPKMLNSVHKRDRDVIRKKFELLGETPQGVYCLIDYVNFKGEGTSPAERYKGEGWGLLQVLQEMKTPQSAGTAPNAFSKAAAAVLTRRVNNSPPERNEKRWLNGWLARCRTYAE
jgi:hypothetical protein